MLTVDNSFVSFFATLSPFCSDTYSHAMDLAT
ncbi:hypothetical protein ALC57_17031 [Trachymyrmex cornetzi]|uniref:Uncharacterized protein n=1 Tax=Trachymyrmex cornetzi TaxID=471704 RepID=A0A195DD79_9HYME|nr:hypothetical protein ALC57_17031 [Trachymyrmex cornetzi]